MVAALRGTRLQATLPHSDAANTIDSSRVMSGLLEQRGPADWQGSPPNELTTAKTKHRVCPLVHTVTSHGSKLRWWEIASRYIRTSLIVDHPHRTATLCVSRLDMTMPQKHLNRPMQSADALAVRTDPKICGTSRRRGYCRYGRDQRKNGLNL